MPDVAELDHFLVQQKFTMMVNKYRVSTIAADGKSEGVPVAYVQQKRMKIREQIDIFGDEAQTQQVLRLKSRKVLELRGRVDIMLPDGTVIGQLQKVFGKSLLRSSWEILDADGAVVATAQESSMAIAILRRAWGFIPVVNDIPCPIPFHFDIAIGGRTVGHYRRLISLVDRYEMDLRGDAERRIDRRVAVAFAIALDALQDR